MFSAWWKLWILVIGDPMFWVKEESLSDFGSDSFEFSTSKFDTFLNFQRRCDPFSWFLKSKLSSKGTRLKLFIIKCKDLPLNWRPTNSLFSPSMRTDSDTCEAWSRSYPKWWLRTFSRKSLCPRLRFKALDPKPEFFSLKNLKTQRSRNSNFESWTRPEGPKMSPETFSSKSKRRCSSYFSDECSGGRSHSLKRFIIWQQESKRKICW